MESVIMCVRLPPAVDRHHGHMTFVAWAGSSMVSWRQTDLPAACTRRSSLRLRHPWMRRVAPLTNDRMIIPSRVRSLPPVALLVARVRAMSACEPSVFFKLDSADRACGSHQPLTAPASPRRADLAQKESPHGVGAQIHWRWANSVLNPSRVRCSGSGNIAVKNFHVDAVANSVGLVASLRDEAIHLSSPTR
jgi:hypothetical protein